jgi:hypothetical protein
MVVASLNCNAGTHRSPAGALFIRKVLERAWACQVVIHRIDVRTCEVSNCHECADGLENFDTTEYSLVTISSMRAREILWDLGPQAQTYAASPFLLTPRQEQMLDEAKELVLQERSKYREEQVRLGRWNPKPPSHRGGSGETRTQARGKGSSRTVTIDDPNDPDPNWGGRDSGEQDWSWEAWEAGNWGRAGKWNRP